MTEESVKDEEERDEYRDIEIEAEKDEKAEKEEKEEKEEVAEKLEVMREELQEKEETIEELKDRVRHLKADFDNYKKRHSDRREEELDKAKGELLMDMVPIYDNLDRAFKSFEKNDDKESFVKGVEKIYAQFDEFLSKQEVEPIEAEGEKFDPNKHQALMRIESDDHGHNEITEEFERGYKYKDEVLKPSKVKVNINPSKEEGEEDN